MAQGTFPPELRRLLFGSPWGEVFPPRQNPRTLTFDARTAGLRVLRRYITDLTFFRSGDSPTSPPIPFKIAFENFHIEWPDSTVELKFPSAVVKPSRGDHDVIGLTAYVQEETLNKFAPGTVVQWQSEYTETINLEIWASKVPERRAIVAGLETAFMPTEQMSGVRFLVEEYFDQLVCFVLNRRENLDEADSARNRRRTQLEIEMRINIVQLVNAVTLKPIVKVNVDVDEDTGLEVDVPEV